MHVKCKRNKFRPVCVGARTNSDRFTESSICTMKTCGAPFGLCNKARSSLHWYIGTTHLCWHCNSIRIVTNAWGWRVIRCNFVQINAARSRLYYISHNILFGMQHFSGTGDCVTTTWYEPVPSSPILTSHSLTIHFSILMPFEPQSFIEIRKAFFIPCPRSTHRCHCDHINH